MTYAHGDIKILRPDGTLKRIVPIGEAMEKSDKEFKKPKPFGQASGGKLAKVQKELKQLEQVGEINPKNIKKEKSNE